MNKFYGELKSTKYKPLNMHISSEYNTVVMFCQILLITCSYVVSDLVENNVESKKDMPVGADDDLQL